MNITKLTWGFRVLVVLFVFVSVQLVTGQTVSISESGPTTGCTPTKFVDTDVSGDYGNNEAHEYGFCTDGTGGANGLYVVFEASKFDIHESDTLYVYNGNSATSRIIAKLNNSNKPTDSLFTDGCSEGGCIYFKFVSDGTDVGKGWEATVGCKFVCQKISLSVAGSIDINGQSVLIRCAGESTSFNAVTNYACASTNNPHSYFQLDGNTTFNWTFGDGGTGIGSTVYHTFGEGGLFSTSLQVTDAKGCKQNFVSGQDGFPLIKVSGRPIFGELKAVSDSICFGDTAYLVGGLDTNKAQDGGFQPNVQRPFVGIQKHDQLYLGPQQDPVFTSKATGAGFNGQTVSASSDIDKICINLEHSGIGDLKMKITCPNGQSAVLMDEVSLGTGPKSTFLGDANNSVFKIDPGESMTYCFTESGTFGTMTTENAAGNYVPSSVVSGNDILTPGSYSSQESFAGLVGCPLDGEWTVEIEDNELANDGYLFSWQIHFNASLAGNIPPQQTKLVRGFWISNPDIFWTNNVDSAQVAPQYSGGNMDYMYRVQDENGCQFDSIVKLYVASEIDINAGYDTLLCPGDPYRLSAHFPHLHAQHTDCQFAVRMLASNGTWTDEVEVIINNTTAGNYTPIAGGFLDQTFTLKWGDSLELWHKTTNGESEDIYIIDCEGKEMKINQANTSDYFAYGIRYYDKFDLVYSWKPGDQVDDPSSGWPIAKTGDSIEYVVTAYNRYVPSCAVTDTIIPYFDEQIPAPTIEGDNHICLGDSARLEVFNFESIDWTTGSLDSVIKVAPTATTDFSADVYDGCTTRTYTLTVNVHDYPIIKASNDTTIRLGSTTELSVQAKDGYTVTWSPLEGITCPNCNPVPATPGETTAYIVSVNDGFGCISYDTVVVSVLEYPFFVASGFTPNGDGINDAVYFRGEGIARLEFKIYDRWGQEVFATHEQSQGWDGTFNGEPLSSGTYVYYVYAVLGTGDPIELDGNITLFR